MTDDEKLMAQYGVTCEQETTYHYKGHKHEKLKDALGYAKVNTDREQNSTR